MFGLIIFGTRGVRSTMDEGQFYCPQCDGQTRYKHKKVTQFFTLYFIPLIPLGVKGRYVECQSCRNTYIERILEMRATIDVSERPQPKNRVSNTPQIDTVENQTSDDAIIETIEDEEDLMPTKQKAIKKLLIMMILADGRVDDQEINVFHKVYKETTGGYVANIYHEIDIVQGKNENPSEYLKSAASFLNDEGKRDVIKACMMIAAADGDIDPSEVKMVEQFGQALEMRPSDVKQIIDATNS
jgi:uncharacterized tellurite resistance protein B-like protein